MVAWETFFSSFFGFLMAFIAKDFYDMFFRGRIRKIFKTYKILIEKRVGNEDGSEDDR